MTTINLKDFYSWHTHDEYIEVSDEVAAELRADKLYEAAYQIRQAFKPGEITPEEANRIGYETAMRWTKGKYAFFVATHTDRQHIHTLEAMEVGPLLGLWLQSFLIHITMLALNIIIFVIVYGRMIEIYLLTSLAPIPVAIIKEGREAYFSSLPVKDIEKNLNDNGIPSSVSYGADNE